MSNPTPTPRSLDPWAAVGRLGGGVFLYGGLGFLLDRWLDTQFLVMIGILLGASLAIYTVIASLPKNP